MRTLLIVAILLAQEVDAQGTASQSQSNERGQPYSHKRRVEYSFQLVDKIHLRSNDPIPHGLLPSFSVFRDGRLSFVDRLSSSVKITSSDGRFLKSIYAKDTTAHRRQALVGHCMDDSGRVWIVDYGLQRISIYGTNGVLQEASSSLSLCSECFFSSSGLIRVTNKGIYVGMIRNDPSPVELKTISSLVTVFDFNHKTLAQFGKPAKNIHDYSVGYDHYTFDLDYLGNLYGAHQFSSDIWKYSSDGRVLQRFNYPVKEYRPTNAPAPPPSVADLDPMETLHSWYTSITTIGRLEIAGKYLFISFANKDPQWTDDYRLRHWHEYLQVFDLDGDCLVDCLKLPGQFLCCDLSGILYFRETDDPENTIISKYRFSVSGF